MLPFWVGLAVNRKLFSRTPADEFRVTALEDDSGVMRNSKH